MDEEFDLKELANAPVDNVPWYFRLGRYLSKHKIRGGDRLLSEARRRGLLDQLVVYPVGPGGVQLRVPLWRPCNEWLEEDVRDYEAAFMRVLSEAVCQLPGPVTLVDCGADIGTVSAHLVSRCRNIQRVLAFEPNPAAHRVLAENLRGLRVRTHAYRSAVGDFTGRGRLIHSPRDPSAHAMFVAPHPEGSVAVTRLDDIPFERGQSLVVKIDVEGTESTVVTGAARTLRNAGDLIVAFEAHPKVAQRLRRDPIEVMSALREQRKNFTFVVDTVPAREINPERRIFDQLPPTRVYNVIATSASSTHK